MPDPTSVIGGPRQASGAIRSLFVQSRVALLAVAAATMTLAVPMWSTPADAAVARTAYHRERLRLECLGRFCGEVWQVGIPDVRLHHQR